MALTQMLYSLERGRALPEGSLNSEKELEDLLSDNIDLLDPNWLVIGRQVTTPNGKALDLLCMDRGYKLIVLELKRELTPREVTAQVIEYASYVAEMEKDALARCYQAYAQGRPGAPSSLNEAFQAKFGVELDESQIDGVPRMVIVAAKMDDGTEHIIRYLRKTYDVDINILFFRVFQGETERFLSRVWFEENAEIDARREYSANWNREYYISFGECAYRKWEDARKYGFVSGGGGKWYSQTLRMLHSGDRVWVNIPHTGYVGVGIVQGDMQQAGEAGWNVDGEYRAMKDMDLSGDYFYCDDDPENAEFVVPIKWLRAVPISQAVKETGFFGNQNTVCRPTAEKWEFTVDRLKQLWGIEDRAIS